jgi:hypothetical protein
MKNEVFVNSDGIIEIKVVGDQTVSSVEDMGKAIEACIEELQTASKPVLLLDDLLEMGTVPPEARKIVVELGKKLNYEKLAFVGRSDLLRFGSNLILQAIGKGSKLKYFDDREEAIEWLKG